jgi:hypothetical protein
VADRVVGAGETLVVTNTAVDAEVPGQTLTFSSAGNPAGSTLNSTNGVFTWRPPVAQAGTTNVITTIVTDSGLPVLSDTNTFLVTVRPLNPPLLRSVQVSGAGLNLVITGDAGPDYDIQSSTNLTDWERVLFTNAPAMPFSVEVTNGADFRRFNRIQLGP